MATPTSAPLPYPDEPKDPPVVFTSFFESFDLDDVKLHLREGMNLLIEKKFKHREYSMEEDNLRFFFEKVEQVMQAAWMMRE